jgi:hypothetical protein
MLINKKPPYEEFHRLKLFVLKLGKNCEPVS